MTIAVEQAEATIGLEAVYREDGARLWRALYAYSNDAELAYDAASEAFAQALGRGTAIRDPRNWVWRAYLRRPTVSQFASNPAVMPQSAINIIRERRQPLRLSQR